MVGIFSRLGSRRGHRRSRSAIETRETSHSAHRTEATASSPAGATCGIEIAVNFKPVKHPVEPRQHDRPVKCPLADPFILNDGNLWREQPAFVKGRVKTELPSPKEGLHSDPEASAAGSWSLPPRHAVLPSLDGSESEVLCLLKEFNAVGDLPPSEI